MKTKKIKQQKQVSEKKVERQKKRVDFLAKKKEMQKLLKEAHATYIDGLRQNKKKNINEKKLLVSEFETNKKNILNDFENKKINEQEKNRLINELNTKHFDDLETEKSMIKNRKLAVISEYKRTLNTIQKTYMEDVIKHMFSYRLKRWVFGLNKEFSRVTWWSKRHVITDFVIIIIIVGILALIFMGIDLAYLKGSK